MNPLENRFDSDYWTRRYESGDFPWDLGKPSLPLMHIITGLEKEIGPDIKDWEILIPGAGNAWEAVWLQERGYRNVWVLDISPKVIEEFRIKHPEFPSGHLICGDFFAQQAQYNLILEQTFFCALEPELRRKYAKKMAEILHPGGMLAGVWFEFPLTEKGPPFGGDREEYRATLSPYFNELKLETCLVSEPSREGKEVLGIWRLK